MQLTIAAVGTRLEPWIHDGFEHYRTRLPRHLNLTLREVPVARPARNSPGGPETEGERLLRHVDADALAVVLDERGESWTSTELARRLGRWLNAEPHVALLVGGPDGLSAPVRRRADHTWSLSPLTLPHGLVRVLLAEQLYRAWTILQGHPYHRA